MLVAQLDEQLCFALYAASNQLSKIYRPLLAPYDLTYTQFIVLMALWKGDGISITELAKRTGLSKATMTPLLKRLEEKKFIERQWLAGNERQKHIVLTAAGQEMALHSGEITEQAFCATTLSKAQAQNIIALCQQIVNAEES